MAIFVRLLIAAVLYCAMLAPHHAGADTLISFKRIAVEFEGGKSSLDDVARERLEDFFSTDRASCGNVPEHLVMMSLVILEVERRSEKILEDQINSIASRMPPSWIDPRRVVVERVGSEEFGRRFGVKSFKESRVRDRIGVELMCT